MRNLIIGAAALLAVAAPGIASAQTGYVGVTWASVDADGADTDDVIGVEGAVAFQGSGSINFEVDAAVADSDDSDTVWGLTGHVYSRNDSYLFGGFVGVADGSDSTTWTAGLEAAKYYARWTLAGSLAYANNDDADVDAWGAAVEARVFPTDNFRLSGTIGWASIDSGLGDDDLLELGVGGEYQFEAFPVSIALAYAHDELDEADIDSDTVSVALRYNWGGTLFDRDRRGASQAGSSIFASAVS
ncbi:hypothetical protein [Terricaulis sp.]|uniref:hypothetical protein n=1 Tax=Terricaulis sp. TaxID=2768686 RepID=UPI003784CD71